MLAVFSQRRAQVQAAIDVREAEIGRPLTRAERSQWGAIATRDRMQYGIETHTWREEIAARAAEHGLDRELADRVVAGGVERLASGEILADGALELAGEPVGESELGQALTGPSGLTELANTFDRWSVLREFAAAAAQGARVHTVRELGERFVARDDVVATTRGTLTSAGLVECERALIKTATARAGEGVARLPERTVGAAIERSARTLNSGQAAAVRAVAGSGNGVDVIEALAGTGKTYTAGVLRELYVAAGYTVIGVAPSARAARELAEQAGIPARTLDSRLLAIANGHPLPERSIVIFDEAGMASTRQSERLFAHAAAVGAKVVVIGDPGQLPSVQAGGWLRAIGDRLGVVRLTEVMRQRDAAERFALAGLHDGKPRRWLDWATPAGRVDVLPDGPEILDQAVAEWAAGVAARGLEESVLIARDNDTRRALNRLARERRREAGALGEDRLYGAVTVAVGDRVICRCNERDLDVDNGTRGVVRHVDRGGLVLETDAHTKRQLPASYVAEHVEHAYALTGHGMQGGTVEQAIVVASEGELTRGWSYTALSRARGETKLLVRDATPVVREREDVGPDAPGGPLEPDKVLARVARRMLERDDEDLALDQLPASGRADDPQLADQSAPEPGLVQEDAAERAEPPVPRAGRTPVAELRDRLERLRVQFAALPTRELARLDDLDARAIELTERRDTVRSALERLPAQRPHRLGRGGDPHLVERTELSSTLGGLEIQLERTLAERGAHARQLGDVQAVRDERDGLASAIEAARREHGRLLEGLVDRELAAQPRWLGDALGDRPDRPSLSRRWDRAARTLARYRIQYEIRGGQGDPLGPEPTAGEQRRDYERAQGAREALGRDHSREAPADKLGID